MYQEIANKINEMIPVEWDKVYTKAYIKEESKEVFSTILYLVVKNYIIILLFLKNIMFQKIFKELLDELYENFERLKKLFIENNQEPWTSCEFDFNNEGKLNVSFDYIDWKNSEFGPLARENYYEYKSLVLYLNMNMKEKKLKK